MLYAYEERPALRLVAQTPNGMRDILIDSSYEQLFAFADMDLSAIRKELARFFTAHVDRATGDVREPTEKEVSSIYDALVSVHPFFQFSDHATALPDILAYTYNAILIGKGIDLSREEYDSKIKALVSTAALHCQNKSGYLESYHDQLLMSKRYYDSRNKPSFTITSLPSFQNYVKAYLYWVLDASAERFGALSMTDRLRLFRQVFGDARQLLCLKEISCIGTPGNKGIQRIINRGEWSLVSGASAEEVLSIVDDMEQEMRREVDRANYAAVLSELNSDELSLDHDVGGWLKKQITAIKKETSEPLFKAYEISSFTDYILLQLRYLTEQSAIIKRCKNCGQYFITERSNIDYCQRILPGETQSCFIIGPRRVYNRTLSDDLPRSLYAKAYKKYQARLRRKVITPDEFNAWKVNAKRYLDDIQNGKISTEEYRAWMEG